MGQGFSESSLRSLTRSFAWILEPEAPTFAESNSWSNKDMDPVPPHKRTWTMLNYVNFWISSAVGGYYVATWIIHACSTVLPPTLLTLLIWAFVKVPPSSQMRHWAERSCFGPGFVLSTVRLDSLEL
jgi:hypothetical protein